MASNASIKHKLVTCNVHLCGTQQHRLRKFSMMQTFFQNFLSPSSTKKILGSKKNMKRTIETIHPSTVARIVGDLQCIGFRVHS